jgi:hypothetical protein
MHTHTHPYIYTHTLKITCTHTNALAATQPLLQEAMSVPAPPPGQPAHAVLTPVSPTTHTSNMLFALPTHTTAARQTEQQQLLLQRGGLKPVPLAALVLGLGKVRPACVYV